MNRILTLFFPILFCTSVLAQDAEADLPENSGDNFSLEGALALFKKASSLEEFEKMLNEEGNNVNNLDLNGDGEIDYILVNAMKEGDTHAIVLSTYLNEKEQIIGVYGVKDYKKLDYFCYIGFIVWTAQTWTSLL